MGGVFVYCRTELLEPFECAGLFRLHAPQIRTEEPAVIVSFRDNMSPTAYFQNMTAQLKLVTLKRNSFLTSDTFQPKRFSILKITSIYN